MKDVSSLASWVLRTANKPTPVLRIFCFPYAGGGASIYQEWADQFPTEVEICPIQLPARENRAMEAPIARLDELLRILVKVLEPLVSVPFVFFGHSMGALISYELARQFKLQHLPTPTHLFISGYRAPHIPLTSEPSHMLRDDDFIEHLRSMQGTPEVILQNKELMQLVLPKLRADFTLSEMYVYMNGHPLDCPITGFVGSDDPLVNPEKMSGWKEHTTREFNLHVLAGDHFFLHDQAPALIYLIQHQLKTSFPAVFV